MPTRRQVAAAERFFTSDLYVETTQQLAQQLAVHYHANAKDAIENLTIPEILTAAELAVSDVRRFVEQNIPGSHLMTIRWLQRAPQVTSFWQPGPAALLRRLADLASLDRAVARRGERNGRQSGHG